MSNKPKTSDVIVLIVWCCLITALIMADIVSENWNELFYHIVGLWFGSWSTIYVLRVFRDRD